MKPGSVIIDIAASTGGNTELTENDKTVVHNGVKIVGQSNYPSTMPADASKMFGTNLVNLLKLMVDKQGTLNLNFSDELVAGCCITHDGKIVNERVKTALNK
jgi:NAD(P) transhydrogenase subunit alpha